ncbi:hypothetical protein [Psychromonas arctica]|uniref:hypothetical protein n=1 Tax=Psychromonas arctica TaxID=168275 RepID=UPI0012EC2C22|nr:hypothetical protein [Psychromonas arctica]
MSDVLSLAFLNRALIDSNTSQLNMEKLMGIFFGILACVMFSILTQNALIGLALGILVGYGVNKLRIKNKE